MAAEHEPRGTVIRAVTATEVRPLRHRVLRPEQPIASTVYPGDDLPGSVHLGAFDGNDVLGSSLVGIASLYDEARPAVPGGWRLRGMATAPHMQRRGVGADLLASCIEHVAAAGGAELWCNARQSALGFYLRAGFEVSGEEFDVPGIGAHVVMARAVPHTRSTPERVLPPVA